MSENNENIENTNSKSDDNEIIKESHKLTNSNSFS